MAAKISLLLDHKNQYTHHPFFFQSSDTQDVSPNLSHVATGGNATLTCAHTSHPSASVRWIHGGLGSLSAPLPPLDDPRLTPSGSELHISSFHAAELT